MRQLRLNRHRAVAPAEAPMQMALFEEKIRRVATLTSLNFLIGRKLGSSILNSPGILLQGEMILVVVEQSRTQGPMLLDLSMQMPLSHPWLLLASQ
jgi:hypothetical protein